MQAYSLSLGRAQLNNLRRPKPEHNEHISIACNVFFEIVGTIMMTWEEVLSS